MCKEESGVADSAFDEGWGTRWWEDIDGGVEKKSEWTVGVGEDGRVGVHGDATVDRNTSGMLDGGWNFSWDEVLLWLTVIEMKTIGKVFELKEGLTWVRKMEVVIWSMMIVTSMMMMIVMIVVIIHPAMFQ